MPGRNVQRYLVAFPHQRDGAADGRLGCHVADHRAVGRPGKPAVGHQRHVVSESLADERPCNAEHLLHSGTTFGPLVANDDNIAWLDLAALDSPEGRRFLVEHPGRAPEHPLLVAGYLDDRAVRGQVAPQNRQAPCRTSRGIHLADDGLVVGCLDPLQVLGQGLARDRHRIAVEQARSQQPLHHQCYTAIAREVGHNVATRWLHVGNIGSAAADPVKVLDAQGHPGFPSDGQQVQHHVG